MKHLKIFGGALAVAVALGAAWYWHARKADAAAAAAPAAAAPAPTALVTTAAPQRRALPLALTAFGEVAPVKTEALSFIQAGQVLRIAVVPGQSVQRGEVIALLASDPAALNAYSQATSAATFARREAQRLRQLLALQLATQSQVDAAARQALDADAALVAQEKLGGSRGSVSLAAPFDGVVTALGVAQGDRVAAGAMIAQLGRTDSLRVNLAIEPARVAELHAGMAVHFDGADGAVTASIDAVHKLIDPKTMMAGATVLLPARGLTWPVGMRVQASVALGRRDGWELPRQAVLTDDGGAYVFEVHGATAHRVAVRKLTENGERVGVQGALDAARPVVVLGNYELEEGMPVRGAAK